MFYESDDIIFEGGSCPNNQNQKGRNDRVWKNARYVIKRWKN